MTTLEELRDLAKWVQRAIQIVEEGSVDMRPITQEERLRYSVGPGEIHLADWIIRKRQPDAAPLFLRHSQWYEAQINEKAAPFQERQYDAGA